MIRALWPLLWLSLVWQLASAFLPPQPPMWTPTWSLQDSTLTMVIYPEGFANDSTILQTLQQFGIVSMDWSTGKNSWVDGQPMDCLEENLRQIKALNRKPQHVFGYANLVKALPWFTPVREKLLDPQYAGFFLQFDPQLESYTVPPCTPEQGCSLLYHDQLQTPQYPSGDGNCAGPCNCGENLPCGEYLFDHRNGTMLRNWLLEEYLYSPLLLGNPLLDGLFIDDFWCSSVLNGTQTCTDPAQGPSEIVNTSILDMGLDDEAVVELTEEWLTTMTAAQQRMLRKGDFTWSLFPGEANANAMPLLVNSTNCAVMLRASCSIDNPYLELPLLSGVNMTVTDTANATIANLAQQTAAFLLMRGPYAWLGFGQWGMVWPLDTEYPALWSKWDTGNEKPTDVYCTETDTKGVFGRQLTEQAYIELDCNAWTASFVKS